MPLPPGTRIISWSRAWFDNATVSTVIEPLVADWQREFALGTSRTDRLVSLIRGRIALLGTLIRLSPRIVFDPLPRGNASRALWRMFLVAGIATLILSTPLMTGFTRRLGLSALLFMLPSNLTFVTAFAPLAAVEFVRRESHLSHRNQRRLALICAAIASAWILVGGGWVTPVANQKVQDRFSEVLEHRRPSDWRGPRRRGVGELTTSELFRQPPADLDSLGKFRVPAEINSRLSLIVLPFALALFRWITLNLSAQRTGFRWTSILIWIAAMTAFFLLRSAGREMEAFYELPQGIYAWVPPVVILLAAIDLHVFFGGRASTSAASRSLSNP